MSTVETPRPLSPPIDDADPFRFGWRYVTIRLPDGSESVDEVPLTEEDVLFPEEGDQIVQTDLHSTDIAYLKNVFNARLARRRRAVVVADCRVKWSVAGIRPMGPDLAVFFNIKGSSGIRVREFGGATSYCVLTSWRFTPPAHISSHGSPESSA